MKTSNNKQALSRRHPPLQPITGVFGTKKRQWCDIFARVSRDPGDGHASTFIRALAHGEKICDIIEYGEPFVIREHMWVQIAHMGKFYTLIHTYKY